MFDHCPPVERVDKSEAVARRPCRAVYTVEMVYFKLLEFRVAQTVYFRPMLVGFPYQPRELLLCSGRPLSANAAADCNVRIIFCILYVPFNSPLDVPDGDRLATCDLLKPASVLQHLVEPNDIVYVKLEKQLDVKCLDKFAVLINILVKIHVLSSCKERERAAVKEEFFYARYILPGLVVDIHVTL